MRKRTVKTGLNHILVAMVIITVATFFHGDVADLFPMSATGETWFTIAGFITGGFIGALGALIAVVGLLLPSQVERDIHLKGIILILAAVIFLFMFLLYTSFNRPSQELQPGETITI